ncbi:MAG: YbaN family protein [Dysgonamonadaceae bacterium]|nr:YbaN family protein [Dysgonamonadaceae bacterium]
MKYLLIVLGIVSLCLGVLGIFLPVLPTTPFLLLSAALFMRSSKRLYHWLLNHKVFGQYIRSFMEDKSIPLKVKVISITVMWVTMFSIIFFVINGKLWLQLLLFAIAIGTTIHILSYKTKKIDSSKKSKTKELS